MKKDRLAALFAWLRGLFLAIALTLLGILLMALAVILIGLSDGWIRALNQVLKVLSVTLGTFFAVRPGGERGLVTGACVGVTYGVLGFCLYALLGESGFSLTTLLGEMLIASAAGAISGCVCANLRPFRSASRGMRRQTSP